MLETRNFVGGLDMDSSLYDVGKGWYLSALNITKNGIEANSDLDVTNIVGNRASTYTLPAGTNKCIGAFSHQLRNQVIYFVYNSNGNHSVLEFNKTTRVTVPIFINLTDSDDIDVLGFTADNKITSVNIYPRDEGDLLFFIDSLGRPTKMDITLFKAGTYTPVTRDILDKGKMPPLSPPAVVYDNDTARRVNNHRNKLFRFKYRWQYDDFEWSTFSPISIVPLPVSILSDIYTNVVTNNNVIRMTANSGGKNVKSIEIAMSYVEKTNDWSDFQSVEVIDKSTFGLYEATTHIAGGGDMTSAYTLFSGTIIPIDTVVNVYLTNLATGSQTLVGTFTTIAGSTPTSIATGIAASMTSIGVVTNIVAYGAYVFYSFNDVQYAFDEVEIIPVSSTSDNIDFSFGFYNDSTYPDIDINESIQLFDYVPDIANAQEMPNGNVLAYAGITEGYDKDTIKNNTITIGTVAAGNGGVVGSLNATTSSSVFDTDITKVISAFTGIPATGTVINFKLFRISDSTVITVATYTTVAGDTTVNVVGALNNYLNLASEVNDNTIDTPPTSMSTYLDDTAYTFSSLQIIAPTTASATNSIASWKWSSEKNIGRVYFDKKGKTNGVLYTDKVTFPAYAENGSQQALLPYINYKINDVPPDWAYSFTFVATKDRTQYIFWESSEMDKSEGEYIYFNVSSFISNATRKPTTATVLSYAFQEGDRLRLIRRNSDNFVFADTYDAAIEGLMVDPVINGTLAPSGTYLKIKKVEPFTSGIGTADEYVLEIYRPTQQEGNKENLVYYEFGRQYPIIDPTLTTRRHGGQVTDQVVGVTPAEYNFYEGDAYFRSRRIATVGVGYADFNVMDRNFVDFYISAVNSIDGRPFIIDINAKRQYYSTLIRFGQAYQANTSINGLNRFYPNNFDEYDYNFGDVTRLKVRDRYMKVFQKFKIGTVPLYNQITKDASGNNVLVVTDRLLNPIQYRIGNFGLSAPESLSSWHFADYGCDTNKGVVWRDSNDGVIPISEQCKINSWATVELPLRTGNFKIYGSIDPSSSYGKYILALEEVNIYSEVGNLTSKVLSVALNDIVLFHGDIAEGIVVSLNISANDGTRIITYTTIANETIFTLRTALINLINAGTLFTAVTTFMATPIAGWYIGEPNFTSVFGLTITNTAGNAVTATVTIESGLIFHRDAYTISFSEQSNTFDSPLSYHTEMMCTLGTTLISFKDGVLYTHDSTVYNRFYGVDYPSWIKVVFNQNPTIKKTFVALTEGASQIWECPEIETQVMSYGSTPQQSNLVASDFENEEGQYNAAFLQDTNSIGGLNSGDDIRGKYIIIKFSITNASELAILNYISVKSLVSALNPV